MGPTFNPRRRRAAAALGLALVTAGAAASYFSGGVVWALAHAAADSGGGGGLEAIRRYLAGWGALAPAAYVALVVGEVLVAPIPGTLLYAPGGAIFGGFLGGTLSLAGNVLGATIACAVAALWRDPVRRAVVAPRLAALGDRLAARGFWLIFLLRLNPLTSSDLVSYAAGLVGVPVWKVTTGTLLGMAPLCYLQAYVADRLFRVLPAAGILVLALGAGYLIVVVVVLGRAGRRPAGESR